MRVLRPVIFLPLSLAFAAGPVFQESRNEIGGWRPLVGPGFEAVHGATFEAPRGPTNLHFRLRLPAGAQAWLNGARLTPNREGDFDISDWLAPKGGNRLIVAGPARATLIATTRVYVAGHTFRWQQGRLHAEILVRNTLENTVNAIVSVQGGGIHMDTIATVPPGVSQTVRLYRDLVLKPDTKSAVQISVVKEEEAMEGGYTFVTEAPLNP